MNDVLAELTTLLEARKRSGDYNESYVANLHHKGLNKILEKVGEECTETILAAKDAEGCNDRSQVISETADLWFHSMVMLSHLGESSESVLAELQRRFGQSGVEEKASRSK